MSYVHEVSRILQAHMIQDYEDVEKVENKQEDGDVK